MELGETSEGVAEFTSDDCCGASTCVHLATGTFQTTADEGRIVIYLPSGTTLDDIDSVSWTVKTTDGYPPHLDMFLETSDPDQSMLTAELAVNNPGYSPPPGGWVYDTCLKTFQLDGDVLYDEIDDNTVFWVTKMGAGDLDAPSSTLGEWKLGDSTAPSSDPFTELTTTEINGNTVVERLEIEIDNWIATSEAYVSNIVIVIDGVPFTLLD